MHFIQTSQLRSLIVEDNSYKLEEGMQKKKLNKSYHYYELKLLLEFYPSFLFNYMELGKEFVGDDQAELGVAG